ncbi:hypothetical protein DL767_010036 [Monosporascus sp. MG133]|nr:hypothetical protein DL767_010036 [Monosporascus sp. MG133]
MDVSFSDDEKRFVLGEIIKVSNLDVATIVEFIRAHNVEPNWFLMQLPGGRNMNQCFGAVENMFQAKYPPPLASFKRKSLSDMVDHPAKRQAIMPPVEPPVAPARVIQPRPPPPNGYTSAPPIHSNSGLTATGKKRGRPSKADKEAQARANYPRSTEYAPITPAPPAPAVFQQQREYVSSPGYEVASSSVDQRQNKRGRAPAADNGQQATGGFPLASPASATGTPRGLPEPLEPGEKASSATSASTPAFGTAASGIRAL